MTGSRAPDLREFAGTKTKAGELGLRLASITGQLSRISRERDAVVTEIKESKSRLALQPKISALLQKLQDRMHAKSLGAFEGLLSAITQDVIPEAGAVKLDLSTKAGLPALTFYLDKGGKLEDVFKGNGGAVTNVLSVGLRYAALSRVPNNGFVVLDEPDCWIAPDRIPNFMEVIRQVAEDSSMQTIIISHHDQSLFPEEVALVRVEDDKVDIIREGKAGGHLAGVRLINVRNHADAYVPLYAGVTAIVGANNKGKSTVLAAIGAVVNDESDDTMIRHDADSMEVHLWLGNGVRVRYVRNRKGSPKVTYSSFDLADLPLDPEESPDGRGKPPDWFRERIKACSIDDIDLQFAEQKTPVFLLDRPPSLKAKLLTAGREASYATRLIERYKKAVASDKDTEKSGEKKLSALESLLAVQGEHGANAAFFSSVEKVFASLGDELSHQAELARIVTGLEALSTVTSLTIPEVTETPALSDTAGLVTLLVKMERLTSVSALSAPSVEPTPSLHDTRALVRLIKGLEAAMTAGSLETPALPEREPLEAVTELSKFVTELAAAEKTARDLEVESTRVIEAEAALALEYTKLSEKTGGACPLCGQPWPGRTST